MDTREGRPLGEFPKAWIHGSMEGAINSDPPLQVHAYSDTFIILRQSKAIHFEAPFLYLILGRDKAILFDTGATRSAKTFPLQETVERLLCSHYGLKRERVELIVAHTHAHGDHVAADSQFEGKAQTRVVGPSLAEFCAFYHLKNWPQETATFDLGDRVLHLIPIPGHETTDMAIYDERTCNVLSSDTFYAGRLYISDWKSYRESIERLYQFLKDRPVRYFLGSHIEMSRRSGVDYPAGTLYQPEETPLELTWEDFLTLREAIASLGHSPRRAVHPKFIITPTRGGQS